MRNKKIFLIIVFCIFYFSFLLKGFTNIFYEQHYKDNSSVLPYLATSNTVLFQWNCSWGGSDHDYCTGVEVDSLGNIYLTGFSYSFGAGSSDKVLLKYDASGTLLWNRSWGGTDFDESFGITLDSLDNIYLTGATTSYGTSGSFDVSLVKYDSSGTHLWNRTWGGNYDDYGYGIALDSSDNIYIVGNTRNFTTTPYNVVLLKYDNFGAYQWNHTWGGSYSDYGYGIALDSSDNIYLTGATSSYGTAGSFDLFLVKYNSFGTFQWNRTWGGSEYDEGLGVALDYSDNIYIVGKAYGLGAGSTDISLLKYDDSGIRQWNCTWGGVSDDYGAGVIIDSSNHIYIGGVLGFGEGDSDISLIKYDSSGVQQWNHSYVGLNSDKASGLALDSAKNIYVAGSAMNYGLGTNDIVLIKYYEENGEDKEGIPIDFIILISIISGVSVVTIFTTAIILRKRKRDNY